MPKAFIQFLKESMKEKYWLKVTHRPHFKKEQTEIQKHHLRLGTKYTLYFPPKFSF